MPSHTHLPAPHLRPTALACTSLILGVMLSGCGGGSSGDAVTQTDSGYQVASGVAQKGPLTRGSSISVNELDAITLAPLGTNYNFEIRDDFGTFQPAATIFKQRLLESNATGYYLDELTGRVSTDTVTLRGMSDLAIDRAININLLTDLSNARIRALMTRATSPLTFSAARLQAQREVLAAFFIYNSTDLLSGGTQPANFGELDLSKKRDADQVLTTLSAVVTQIGITGGGITQFINQFEADLADDGKINNSPKFASPLTILLNTAYKTVDFDRVANNLNKFYNATLYTSSALSKWVDTSGGIDGVIDRHKSETKNVLANTESKSSAYVIGSDDAGQCISASAGKLYRNGALVTAATIKAVKGEQYTLGLTGLTNQAKVVGNIQRSPPSAGICPATPPTTGITKISQYSILLADTSSPDSVIDIIKVSSYFNGTAVFVLKQDGSVLTWGAGTRGKPTLYIKDTGILNLLPNYWSTSGSELIKFTMKDGAIGNIYNTYDPTLKSYTKNIIKTFINTDIKKECTYRDDSSNTSTITLKKDGKIWVQGSNTYGQLGDGTTFPISTPTNIGADYVTIECLGFENYQNGPSILAMKSDGTLWGWGANKNGILGDGLTSKISTPKLIGSGYSSIKANYSNIIGLKSDGSLWSWGSGITGNGTSATYLTPQKIGIDYTSVEINGLIIAKKSNGSLWTWGQNVGKIIGTPGDVYIPMPIDPSFTSIQLDNSTYNGSIFGFKKDGSLWGWSENESGQLGDGTTTPSTTTPKLIGTGYKKFLPQGDHVFAIKNDGTLWAWGSNGWGQLGDGTTSNSLTPKQVVLP